MVGRLRFVLLALVVACAENGSPQCRVGADCASGMCRADGTCVPLADGGVDPTDAGEVADDANPPERDAEPIDAAGMDGGLGCTADRDGRITRAEVPLRAGLRATFAVATDVAFDTAGEALASDRRRWDLTGPFEGDATVLVETRSPSGTWWESQLPGATYATELAAGSDLLGVFAVEPDALALLGVVSPEDGIGRTELANDPAVDALRFPLELGDSWDTMTTVSGVAMGVGSFYTERYQSAVDRAGELVTSFGTFEVLRVRTELTRTVGVVTTRLVSFAFVSECFGTVATLRGQDNDTGAELSELAELRRLVP